MALSKVGILALCLIITVVIVHSAGTTETVIQPDQPKGHPILIESESMIWKKLFKAQKNEEDLKKIVEEEPCENGIAAAAELPKPQWYHHRYREFRFHERVTNYGTFGLFTIILLSFYAIGAIFIQDYARAQGLGLRRNGRRNDTRIVVTFIVLPRRIRNHLLRRRTVSNLPLIVTPRLVNASDNSE